MKTKKRIGFFGGCFNPITNAHIQLIEDIIKKDKLDKVYFVPMGNKYQKQGLIEFIHRKRMIELVFEKNERIDVLDILENKETKTYAIETFKIIDEQFKNDERFYIMGSDNFENIEKWKDSEELIKNYKYIILDRKNISSTKEISSSKVREMIKNNKNIAQLVPEIVEKYISENKLYK